MIASSQQPSRFRQLLGVFLHLTISVGGLIVARLLTTVTQMILARRMGLEDFGIYTSVYTLLGPAIMIASLGMDTWLLRQSNNIENFNRYISEVIWLRVFSTILCLAISIPFIVFDGDTPITFTITVLAAFSLFFELLLSTSYTILRAQLRNYAAAGLQVLVSAMLILMVWLMWSDDSPVVLVTSYRVFTSLVGVALMFWLLRHTVRFVWNIKAFWNIIKSARLYFTSDLLANVTGKADLTLVTILLDTTAAGTYGPALTVINTTFLVPTVLWQVFLPMMARQQVGSRGFRSIMWLNILVNGLYGIVCTVMVTLAAPQLIDILFGHEFIAAVPLLQIMSLIPLVKSFNFSLTIYMVVRDRQGLRTSMLAISAIFNVIANLVILPIYGLTGAAWVNLVTEFVTFACYAYGAFLTNRGAREHSAA